MLVLLEMIFKVQLEKGAESFTRLIQREGDNNIKGITHITKGINYPAEILELGDHKMRTLLLYPLQLVRNAQPDPD